MFLTIATQTALIGQSPGFLIGAATPIQVIVDRSLMTRLMPITSLTLTFDCFLL